MNDMGYDPEELGAVPLEILRAFADQATSQLMLRWQAMEGLEVLAVDLRVYSRPGRPHVDIYEVRRLARSLRGKGLKLLVIAGLRSWSMYDEGRALKVADVEGGWWDPNLMIWRMSGRIGANWWKEFMRAVRPGGRLVFVDRHDGGA